MKDEKFGFWHFLHVNPLIKYALLLLIFVLFGIAVYCVVNKGYSLNTNGLNAPANVETSVDLKDSPFVEKKTDIPKFLTPQIKYPNIAKKTLLIDTNKPIIGSVSQVKNLNVGTNFGQVGDTYSGIKPREVTPEILKKIMAAFPNKKDTILIMVPPDKESNDFGLKIRETLIQNDHKIVFLDSYMGLIPARFDSVVIIGAPDYYSRSIAKVVTVYPPKNTQ